MESSEKSMPRCEKQNSDAKSHLNPNYSEEMIYALHHPTTIRDLDDKNIKNSTRQEKEMRRLDDEKIEKLLKNCTILQHRFILNKLKLQCHYKQRMQKAEIRRKKIINRLKYFYDIDVELLKKNVADEIVVGIQKVEKERRIKEKRKAEGMMVMISRLLEEQRRKREVVVRRRPELKKSKPVIGRTDMYFEMPDESIWTGEFDEEESNISVDEQSAENVPLVEESFKKILKQDEVTSKQEDEKMKKKSEVISAPLCSSATRQKVLGENLMATSFITDLNEASNLAQKKAKMIADLATAEKLLKATPETIIFKNFECEKSYNQELKITNIGTSSLQCRFLEVEFDEVYEDLCPLKILILNRPLLRPGLSFTINITLYTTSLTEIKGTLLFQTKRKKSKENNTYFRVPFICTPVSAVVSITPSKIIFPALPWCCATGPKKSKKILRVKNLGGRKCVFRIMASESCLETEAEEENVKEEEDGNEQGVEDLKNLEVQETEEKRVSVATEHEDSPEAIKEELLNNVFAAFRFSKKYHIELEPYSTKQIEVTFCPQYKGLHCDLYNLQFEGCSNCFEQTIMLTGDIEKVPLRFEPTVIDLQTCIMDSGVYQGVFKVYNDSSKTFPVIAKIPKCMKNFCQIYPREPVVQSLGFCIFSLKFYPSSSLKREARSFYCPETQILEFPIYIRPNTSYSCKSFASCKPDYLKIYVLALITDYALELNPAQINFGTVTTLETVKKEISLTNHSLSMQEYGFLNLPKGVRVEPNMGFGKIFPKETITLFVLYSPVLEHVEGNDAGLQGIEGRHNFRISVTSVAELGRMKKSSYGSNQDTASEIETSFLGESDGIESLTPEDKFLPPEAKPKEHTGPIREIIEMVPENTEQNLTLKIQEKEEKIREFLKRDDGTSECSFSKAVGQSNSTKPEAGIGKANSSEEVFLEEENSIILTDSSEKISSIQCTALVIDPYCELSSTIIQLPATPCTSFSITKFQIIGANFSTATKCYCGFNDKNQKSFSNKSLQFEFQYDFPQIRIEPRSGYFKIGENVPIWIIFRPEIPADKIEQESKMQKSAQILEELNKEKEKEPSAISIPKPVKGKKGKEKKKKESETPKPQTIEDVANSPLCQLNESDLFNAEKSLLQTMEPFHSEIKISCIIKTDDQTRSESHDMIIISPVIKPDFVYLGNSQKITFGKVPIGSKATFLIKIQNIKMKKISPALSILNPFGPFYYPIGKVQVDPEHVWVVPITFTPFEEKDYIEFFEIRSDKTILLMKTTGEGIEAKFSMVPNFSVVRVDTKPGGSAEFKFNFENSCGGNLSLKIMKEFTKAKGESRASLDKGKRKPQTSGEIRPSVDKGKIKPQTIETEITEEISQEIESAYTELPENEDLIFTLLELNEELLIPPYAKADIKIQFTPPPGEENKSYVTKFKIMLGKWKILKEFLIFGTVTKRK